MGSWRNTVRKLKPGQVFSLKKTSVSGFKAKKL